jgi:hypothetical protein
MILIKMENFNYLNVNEVYNQNLLWEFEDEEEC